MGMRVRKAAKVLGCSPEEVIGLLLALGITRYKTTQDQLSDRILAQLQDAVRSGVKPVQTIVKEQSKKSRPSSALKINSTVMDDLMRDEEGASPANPTVDAMDVTVARPEGKIQSEENLQIALRELARQKVLLAQERQVFAEQQRAHEVQVKQALQDKLAFAVTQSERELATSEPVVTKPEITLGTLMKDRGLTTFDQWDAALASLGKARLLAPMLETLVVSKPQDLKRLLSEKLLLVEGETPAATPPGIVPVEVPVGSGEVPNGVSLEKGLSTLSERLLLHGLRRVLVCGGTHIGWWYLKEAMDDRIGLEVVGRLSGADLSADIVILWGYKLNALERTQLELTPATVLEVGSSRFEDLFTVTEAFFH